MNREELDAFFAKAEDVLADWEPNEDAMVARVEDEGAELPVADSYYSQQPWGGVFGGWFYELESILVSAWERAALFGESLGQATPQGIVTIPLVQGFSPLAGVQQWIATEEAQKELAEAYPLVDFERVWLATTCDKGARPTETAEIVVPPLPAAIRDRYLPGAFDRNTGPLTSVGLDGRYRPGVAR